MEYIKHPIILGLLTCGMCFLYLKINEYNEKKNNPDAGIEHPKMKYPILLGIVVFLTFSILSTQKTNHPKVAQQLKLPTNIISEASKQINIKMIGDVLPPIFLEAN